MKHPNIGEQGTTDPEPEPRAFEPEPEPVFNPEEIREQLIEWIDVGVIADAILDGLEENLHDYDGFPSPVHPNLEDAQAVWLSFLETHLVDGIRAKVEHLIEERS